jgi:glutamate-1-semialdehyde 2,1-aminomutase
MLEQGLNQEAEKAGIPVTIQRVGSMITVFFSDKPVKNMDDAMACDHEKFKKFFTVMLENGIHLPPSGYEAWFVSTAHTEDVIEKTLQVAGKAFEAVK